MVLKGETEMKMKRWWRWGWSVGQAGSNEGGRWCSSSRPSPLWPPREASFFSAAACGSRAEETLRERRERVQGDCDYDEHKESKLEWNTNSQLSTWSQFWIRSSTVGRHAFTDISHWGGLAKPGAYYSWQLFHIFHDIWSVFFWTKAIFVVLYQIINIGFK